MHFGHILYELVTRKKSIIKLNADSTNSNEPKGLHVGLDLLHCSIKFKSHAMHFSSSSDDAQAVS